MALGDATAADVPGKYDVVIAGKGYVFADTVDPSLPFRTHRAIYDLTPTFIERQNISGSWGDDQLAFFLTQTQKDWSLGGGQRYLNDPSDATQVRKFWSSLRAEVTVEGEVSLGATARARANVFDSANIMGNPDFETGTTTNWSAGTGNTIAADATNVHSGAWACKCTLGGTNTTAALSSSYTTTTGLTYTGRVWVWIPSSFTGSAVSLTVRSVTVNANMSLRNQWQQITVTFSSSTSASVLVNATANNGDIIWVDDAYIGQSGAAICGTPGGTVQPNKHILAQAADAFTVDASGTIVDLGAHSGSAYEWGLCTDGAAYRITGTAGITANSALAFLNGLLYNCDGSTLTQWSAASPHVGTTIYTWKDSVGTILTVGSRKPKLLPYGGKLLIWWPQLTDRPELWQYDGTSTKIVAALPSSVIGHDVIEIDGLVYISGCAAASKGGSTGVRPTIWTWDSSSIAKIWESPYIAAGVANAANIAAMPALGSYNGDLVFTDPAQLNGPYATALLMRYVLATGAIYPLDSYTVTSLSAVTAPFITSTGGTFLLGRNDTTQPLILYPYDYSGQAQLDTSLFTFNNSLTKVFRGVTVEWSGDTAPNVYYQVDSVDGSYTLLANGVTSGAETVFPSNTTGRGISIRVVIPSGTTKIKRIYVRAAPELAQFKRSTYILDCTATAARPRQLRNGEPSPLTGYEMVQNLVTAAKSATPVTVTDKVNGTFTAFVDLQDTEGWDVYEVHPYQDDVKHPGSYLVRLTVREV